MKFYLIGERRGCRLKHRTGLLDFRYRTDKTHPTVYIAYIEWCVLFVASG